MFSPSTVIVLMPSSSVSTSPGFDLRLKSDLKMQFLTEKSSN